MSDALEDALTALRAVVVDVPSPPVQAALYAVDRLVALPVGVARPMIVDTFQAMI